MTIPTLYTVLVLSLALLIKNGTGLKYKNTLNGLEAKPNDFKYMISLQTSNVHICGGVLIRPDIVLTYDDCAISAIHLTNTSFVAVAGATYTNDKLYEIGVAKVYLNKVSNNIAVLRLQSEFDVRDGSLFGLVSLPKKNEKFFGKTGVVSGFGFDEFKVKTNPKNGYVSRVYKNTGKLKYQYVDIVETSKCMVHPEKDHGFLCGQMKENPNEFQRICQNELGDPLVVDNKLVGIVSKLPLRCNELNSTTVYAEVSNYSDFINDAINNNETSDMFVKTLKTILTIPRIGLTVITDSIETIKMVEKLNSEFAEIQRYLSEETELANRFYNKIISQDKSKKVLEEKIKILESIANITSTSNMMKFQDEYKQFVSILAKLTDNKKKIDEPLEWYPKLRNLTKLKRTVDVEFHKLFTLNETNTKVYV